MPTYLSERSRDMMTTSTAAKPNALLTIIISIAWLFAASAVFVETDAYRYASAVLAIIALVHFLKMPNRPATNWLGWLCMAWGIYVAVRFLRFYIMTHPHESGASEWLYAFPFFFPILGVAFSMTEGRIERIVAAFFAVALVMLAATTGYVRIFAGETVKPLIMNNQIHGAVACGLILLSAYFWWLHYLSNSDAKPLLRRFGLVVAPVVMILCLIAIYGAKSKGVWLALTLTLPIAGLLSLTYLRLRTGLITIVAASILLGCGAYAVRHNLNKTAGPTVDAAISMLEGFHARRDFNGVVLGTIDSPTTPVSMDERLQLWYDAGELISSAPVFGWGSKWVDQLNAARYPNVRYTLFHNGYLEILVRFGIFGAVIMSVILGALFVSVFRAFRAGVIPRAAFHVYTVGLFFFALTLLSNSNNRLAIGESLALLSSAFACWCNMRTAHDYDALREEPGARG
ncbi:O-antigen ligase domain-containing protein [Rhizobium sp. rho-13.1]|nr:O-antigen ligase domain-containing protein [Rhizobium sp. rho-13.1]TQY15570.1 O-antigen ligase domain-containing protein [Rhizobium sp. rho-1.1]